MGFDEQPDRNYHKGYYFYQSEYYVTISTNDRLLRQPAEPFPVGEFGLFL